MVVVWTPTQWIVVGVIFIAFSTLSFIVLRSEIQKRKKATTKFTTKWFKWFSITCITSGFLMQLFYTLIYIPWFCTIAAYLGVVSSYVQGISMTYYQLFRLYYCFANEQIHSDKGYPKSLFIAMYTIGAIIGIMFVMSSSFGLADVIRPKCGFFDNYYFYYEPLLIAPVLSGWLFVCAMLSFIIWDVSTLILYIMQIRKFHKHISIEPIIHKRIMLILYKITVLTLFYQIVFCFLLMDALMYGLIHPIIGYCIYALGIALQSLSLSISMYLMMEHNELEYVKLLRIIHKFKLHWICCKYRYIVIEQLSQLEENKGPATVETTNKDTTDIDTQDLSLPKAVPQTPRKLSPATLTNLPIGL